MPERITSVAEEFLECIYRLQEKRGVARTSDLVKLLKVATGTITNTIERLERKELVIHEPYRGVKLTEKGRKTALAVVRRHRLSERLLTDILHMDWNKVHEEACRLEHGISDEMAKKIERTLDHPRTCPHGNPIPTQLGGILEEESEPLTELAPREKAVVAKITEEKSSLLGYLESLGLKPDARLEVIEKAPFNGPITVRIDGNSHALSRRVASIVRIRRLDES